MINSIQILRGIAALLVVYAHIEFLNVKVGSFGVDIFFIISGFIIAYMVNKDTSAFLYRRVVRIIPLYYSMTILTAALAIAKPAWFKHVIVNAETMLKSLLFIPYRLHGSGPVLSLGWTLNLEMFFYFVTFLCILAFGQKKSIWACQVILTIVVIVSYFVRPDSYEVAFLSQGIILEFVLGTLLYYFWKKNPFEHQAAAKAGLIFLGLLALPFMFYADRYLEMERFVKFGIPALLLTNAFLLMEPLIRKENRFFKTAILIGDSSYAMYLAHPFIIYAFIRLVFAKMPTDNIFIQFIELLITLAAVCIISILMHQWYEKPVMKLLRLRLDGRFDKKKKGTVPAKPVV